MLRYLIFVIFGILLFVFLNHKDGFSIGISIWLIPINADASGDRPRILATDPRIQLPPVRAGGGNEEENLRIQVDEFLRTPYATDDRGRVVGGQGHYQIYTAPCENVPPEPNFRLSLNIKENYFSEEPPARWAARRAALAAGQHIASQSNIARLYTEVCSRVNELFIPLDLSDANRELLTRKINEAILTFIGESRTSIQILGDITQASRAQLHGLPRLPNECAAMIYAQCLDIPETNEILLDLLFEFLNSFFIYHPLLLQNQESAWNNFEEFLSNGLMIAIVRIVQALHYYRQHGRDIEINDTLIRFLLDHLILLDVQRPFSRGTSDAAVRLRQPRDTGRAAEYIAYINDFRAQEGHFWDDRGGIPPNTYYQYMWIYIHREMIYDYLIPRPLWYEWYHMTFRDFVSIVERVYKALGGPDFCDDSGG